jgi:hypothetical protein
MSLGSVKQRKNRNGRHFMAKVSRRKPNVSQGQIDLNKNKKKKAKEIKKIKKKLTERSRPNTFEATRVANGDEPNDVHYHISNFGTSSIDIQFDYS